MCELLAHGANVNIKSKGGWTPLMEASFGCRLAFARLLCDAPGFDLAARGGICRDFELTALGWALRRKHPKVAAFLRSRGAPK